MALRDFGRPLPIYVTRKTANGLIAQYTLSIWMSLLVMGLAWINIVVWGCVGLYEAGKLVF